MVNERYLIAYTVNYKGFSNDEPFIYEDFESSKFGCYNAVKKLKEEGYTQVTAFIAEEAEIKPETYTWEYVRKHKCIVR